jgi:hypothetical protein
MLSGVRPIHPEIVGWSTAPRGQVINESLGQVPKKLVSRPARAGKDRIITDPIGYETGWTIARSLGEVGTTSVHSNPVFACNDCTFLDELHRATLEKKIIVGKCLHTGFPTPRTVVGIVFSCPLVCRFHDHIPGQGTTAPR